MKRPAFLLFLLIASSVCLAQNVYTPIEFPTVSNLYSPLIQANLPPNSPVLAVCHSPANQVPCTNYATTYNYAGTACPNGAQDVPQPATTSACQSTGDAQGNLGFWAPPGQYDYTVCIATTCLGPYTVSVIGSNGAGSITVNGGSALTYPVNFQNGTNTTTSNPTGSNVQYNVANASSSVLGVLELLNDLGGTATAPTVVNGSHITNSSIPNSGLVNDATTVNGQTCTLGGTCTISSGFPSGAQIGDTLRYNVYGDGKWDSVNWGWGKVYAIYYDFANGVFSPYGASGIALTSLGSVSNQAATTSDSTGGILSAAASASANTVLGVRSSGNSNYGSFSIGSFYRWTNRFAAGNTTNVRYWMGFTLFGSTGGGTSNVDIFSTASLAHDTPSRGLIGFRYSATTDTDWQAAACLNAGTCTFVDTLIPIDTNPHFFDMTTTGTVVTYFIDGAQVAQISTNVPPYNLGTLSSGWMFMTGDNKNTATAISGTEYWMSLSPK